MFVPCKSIGCSNIPDTGEDFCPKCKMHTPPQTTLTVKSTDPRLAGTHFGLIGVTDCIPKTTPEPTNATLKDSNPKDSAASSRVPLHMVPDTLNLFAAMALAEGDSKYIAYNYRGVGVRVSVYVSALKRHLMRYFNGEWADKKTGVPHLASVAACTAILIDGHVMQNITDDRPPAIDLDAQMAEAERVIAHVYSMNKDIRPKGVEYTELCKS